MKTYVLMVFLLASSLHAGHSAGTSQVRTFSKRNLKGVEKAADLGKEGKFLDDAFEKIVGKKILAQIDETRCDEARETVQRSIRAKAIMLPNRRAVVAHSYKGDPDDSKEAKAEQCIRRWMGSSQTSIPLLSLLSEEHVYCFWMDESPDGDHFCAGIFARKQREGVIVIPEEQPIDFQRAGEDRSLRRRFR